MYTHSGFAVSASCPASPGSDKAIALELSNIALQTEQFIRLNAARVADLGLNHFRALMTSTGTTFITESPALALDANASS
jgi:hypothetical protein